MGCYCGQEPAERCCQEQSEEYRPEALGLARRGVQRGETPTLALALEALGLWAPATLPLGDGVAAQRQREMEVETKREMKPACLI